MPIHAVLCCLISIHVRAASGAPLADARVVMTDLADRRRVVARSNDRGIASLKLARASYLVDVARRGFASARLGPIVPRAGERIEIALQPLDSAQLHVIATVRVNGADRPVRTATPHISISRAEMERAGVMQASGSARSRPATTSASRSRFSRSTRRNST